MWQAVFADMGTALLAVVNSTRTIGKNKDFIGFADNTIVP
jgi:hypothetical protein